MKLAVRLCLVAAMAVGLWQLSHGVRSAWYEYNGFHGVRTHPSHPPAYAVAHGLRDVAFPGDSGATIRGWYLPSRTGAAVVLAGGTETDRSAMWPYAELLSAGGTGVLMFDWPGCGTSDGRVVMGEPERVALQNGISFVLTQPDVHDQRVGVIGFSLGSYIAVLETARDPRAKLLVLEGLFDNPWIQTKALYAPAGVLAQLGGMLSDYLAGLRPDAPRTSEHLPTLRVHSLVLVAGDADRTVSIAVSKALYDIAAEPKAFWVIRSGVHGGYLAADTTYGPRLRAIVERTLAAPAAAAAAH